MENDDDIDLHKVRPKDDQVRQTIYQTFQKTQEKARRQQGLGSQPRVSVIKADRSVSGKKLRLRAKNGGRASAT
jgi:ribosomal protein L44E